MNKETRDLIRQNYKQWRPRSDPYQYGGAEYMTPIESNVWHDIRANGLPMYPQFPVDGYFLDFADPVNKIAIEVDGKEFHSSKEHKEKDREREKNLMLRGWRVYRLQGRQTYKDRDFFVELCDRMGCSDDWGSICEEHFEEYKTDCSEGILLGIYDRI
jgi:very-short-patch-repair endonuclease